MFKMWPSPRAALAYIFSPQRDAAWRRRQKVARWPNCAQNRAIISAYGYQLRPPEKATHFVGTGSVMWPQLGATRSMGTTKHCSRTSIKYRRKNGLHKRGRLFARNLTFPPHRRRALPAMSERRQTFCGKLRVGTGAPPYPSTRIFDEYRQGN